MLLRGARQTGKTTAVRNFAKHFDSFVELNFEKDKRLSGIFDGNFDVQRIVRLIDRTIPAFTNALRTSPHLAFTLE